MQKNGRCIVVVNRAVVRQLPQICQADAPLQVLGVVEAVGGEDPALELLGGEAVEVWRAGHAVLEVAVAEGAREVELAVDAVLLALLEHDAAPVDHLHQLLLIAQVVGRSQLVRLALAVHAEQLAVAQVGHHQRLLEQQRHQGSGPFFVLFYNFSLHLLEHYHHASLTFEHGALRLAEDVRVRGQFPEELGLQEVCGLRIAVAVNNCEEAEVWESQVQALARGSVTRSRLSFLRPWWVNEVKFYSCERLPLSSPPFAGDRRAEKDG